MMDALTGFRVFVALTCVAIMIVMLVRFFPVFGHMSRTLKFFMMAMMLLFVTVAWDTVKFAMAEAEFSWRLLPLTLAIGFCVAALAEPPEALRRRYGIELRSQHEAEIKQLRIAQEELKDHLYDVIRNENDTATQLVLAKIELERLRLRSERSAR